MNDFCDLLGTPYAPVSKIAPVKGVLGLFQGGKKWVFFNFLLLCAILCIISSNFNPLLFFNVLQIYDIADLSEVHFVNFLESKVYIIRRVSS